MQVKQFLIETRNAYNQLFMKAHINTFAIVFILQNIYLDLILFSDDCYRNYVFLDICAIQVLQYSNNEVIDLINLLPPKTTNTLFFRG